MEAVNAAIRPRILTVMLLTAALFPVAASAGLNGGFLWPGSYTNWNQARWAQEFQAMQGIGMNIGLPAYAVNETNAIYPTTIPGLTPSSSDSIEPLLAAADASGFQIYLGLLAENAWWSQTDTAYLDHVAALSESIATELYARYQPHPSFKGFYLPQEIDNCRWWAETDRRRLVDHLLKPVSDHVKGLNPNLVFCEAPFYNPACQQPAEYRTWWTQTLAEAPGFDLVIPQDGIGANPDHITFQVITDYFTALKGACDATSRTLWSDLEVFEKVGVPEPPPTMDRIINQINVEQPLVQRIVVWEWGYIAPDSSVRGLDFYNNYQRYLAGKKLLRQVYQEKSCSISPVPSPAYPDSGGKLADGKAMFSFDGNAGWLSPSTVTITQDLGAAVPDLLNLRAYFDRDSESAVNLPSRVRVSLSGDGSNYVLAGDLAAITQDNQAMNPYQLMLASPEAARYVKYEITPGANWLMCSELGAYRIASNPGLLSQGKSYTLLASPSTQYPDNGHKLTDGVIAFTWAEQVGWFSPSTSVTVTLNLGAPSSISRVEAYAMRSDSSAVSMPSEVTAALSADGQNYGAAQALAPETNQNEAINCFSRDKSDAIYRYVRLTCKPGAGWLMLCEVKVFGESLSGADAWNLY
ncbi:MAG: DUF4434 domain-containing protein [bacterium]